MGNVNCIFKRKEIKYMLSREQYDAFKTALGDKLVEDAYSKYTVENIYYDTGDDVLVRRSIEKPLFKEKLRVRCYGKASEKSPVFVELKEKYKGVVYKRRVCMPFEEAKMFLCGKSEPKGQIQREIAYFIKKYKVVPKLFLAYDREAYVCRDCGTRITFDTNIRSRKADLDICSGDYGEQLFFGEYYLMEIKAAGAMPIYLVRILSELEIYPQSFSKYGSVYKKDLRRRENV